MSRSCRCNALMFDLFNIGTLCKQHRSPYDIKVYYGKVLRIIKPERYIIISIINITTIFFIERGCIIATNRSTIGHFTCTQARRQIFFALERTLHYRHLFDFLAFDFFKILFHPKAMHYILALTTRLHRIQLL